MAERYFDMVKTLLEFRILCLFLCINITFIRICCLVHLSSVEMINVNLTYIRKGKNLRIAKAMRCSAVEPQTSGCLNSAALASLPLNIPLCLLFALFLLLCLTISVYVDCVAYTHVY